MHQRLTRWLGALAGAATFLLLLLILSLIYLRTPLGGLSGFIQDGLHTPYFQRFGLKLLATEILPIYLLGGLVIWLASAGLASIPGLLGPRWWQGWKTWQAMTLTGTALLWIHLTLWWQVPTVLWLVPGINRLPFFLAFPLMGGLALAGIWWVIRPFATISRRLLVGGLWLVLWTTAANLPGFLSRTTFRPAPSGTQPARVLMIGLDGLRQDASEELGLPKLAGVRYPNAYTAIPATRLLYGILWGGDPEHYSVGHAFPAWEELQGKYPFLLVRLANAKGLHPRFFIDDGGTIGLAGRDDGFDDVEMPARGWENFVNSNLAPFLPLYASWLNTLRIFPTTTPWTPLDAGLITALERGRGSGWVMYHSCLAHQPIFLSRPELKGIEGWWRMRPLDLRAKGSWVLFTQQDIERWDPRKDPYLAYRIRMRSILQAWEPVWNRLKEDPTYGQAVKVLFSDHGERFYQVAQGIHLQGIHGFNIDPWEARVPLLLNGPGLPSSGTGPSDAVSLLDLRDLLAKVLFSDQKVTVDSIISGHPACIRYHTINGEILRPPEKEYRDYTAQGIVKGLAIGPDGLWALQYEKPASERSQDVSVARAEGAELTVFKPLKKGGAHKIVYQGYQRIHDEEIPEEAFQKEKRHIESIYFGEGRQEASRDGQAPAQPGSSGRR